MSDRPCTVPALLSWNTSSDAVKTNCDDCSMKTILRSSIAAKSELVADFEPLKCYSTEQVSVKTMWHHW